MSKFTLSPLFCALAMTPLCFSAGVSAAQNESDIEVIKVTARPFETPVSALPGTVQIITEEEILSQAAVSADISSLLANLVPSFGPETQMMSSTYQGFRGRKTIVMIDGVVVSNTLRETSRVLSSISVENIARIEVIQGASAVYGNGESAGVVNLITHEASSEDVAFWTQAKVDGSAHNSDSIGYHLSQRVSGTVKDFTYLAQLNWRDSGTIYDGDGDQIPSDPAGRGGQGELEDIDALVKFGLDIDDDASLKLNLHHRKLENQLSFGRKTIFGDVVVVDPTKPFEGEAPYSKNQYAQLIYQNDQVAAHRLKAELSLSNSENTQANTVLTESDKKALRIALQPLSLPRENDVLTYGIDYQIDETRQMSSKGICEICNVEQTNIAPFVEYELHQGAWTVQAGVRWENFDLEVPSYQATGRYGVVPYSGQMIQGGDLSYDKAVFNAGVVYQLDNSEIYASFSQGYGLGDLRRLRSITVANVAEFEQQMSPTEADNFELGYRGSFGDFSFDIGGFYTRTENGQSYVDIVDQVIYGELLKLDPRLVFDQSKTWNPDAIDALALREEKTYGFEVKAQYYLNDVWMLGATYSKTEGEYQHPTQGWIDMNNARISPEKAMAYIRFDMDYGFGGALQLNYVGDKNGSAPIDFAIPQNGMWGSYTGYAYYEAPVEGYTTLDLSLYYKSDYGQFTLGIKNLLDKTYKPAYSQMGAGSVYGQVDLPPSPTLDYLEGLVRDYAYNDSYNAQGMTFTLGYQISY